MQKYLDELDRSMNVLATLATSHRGSREELTAMMHGVAAIKLQISFYKASKAAEDWQKEWILRIGELTEVAE